MRAALWASHRLMSARSAGRGTAERDFQRDIIIFSELLCKWSCDVKYKGQLLF